MIITKLNDFYFFEGSVSGAKIIRHYTCKLDGFFKQTQLNSLETLQHKIVNELKNEQVNIIINFKYGQKSSFWRSLISLDDVFWYAEGDLIYLNETELEGLFKKEVEIVTLKSSL
jgi:hypothetical protein